MKSVSITSFGSLNPNNFDAEGFAYNIFSESLTTIATVELVSIDTSSEVLSGFVLIDMMFLFD